nr:Ycf15 [Rupiphila tachiroei]YP_010396894.1 Ycf15 [Rupiphila tachiroei]UQJ76081.1 Ycf15 [Rupiphila tachiroei]UQJ76082.1 Ycf15 [Rupiphila tachiroei]
MKEVDLLASLTVQSSSRRAPFLLGPQIQNVRLAPTVHHGRKDSLSRDH